MEHLKHILVFTFFLFTTVLFSQQDVIQKSDTSGFYKLNEVVITATRTTSNTIELANSISVIDSAEIVNKNSFNTFDAIKNEYGVSFTQQGGKASVSNIYIRGGSPSQSLVIIDGVEVNMPNDPSNFYNFFSLPLDNTSRVEILRGPQSMLYGSDAVTGVINIITLKGRGKPVFNIGFEGGSYNSYRGTINSLGSIGRFNYSAAFSRTNSDGYSSASEEYGNIEKDGFTIYNFNTMLGYDFSDSFDGDLVIRYNKSSTNLDQSTGQPEYWDDPTYTFDQEEYFFRLRGNLKLMDNKWRQKIGISYFRNNRGYSYDTSAASIYYSWSNYDGRKIEVDWQNDFYFFENNLLTAGIDFKSEEASSEYYSASYLYSDESESLFPQKSIYIVGIYLEDQVKIGKSFFGTLGIRYDYHSQIGLVLDQALSFNFGSTFSQVPITGRIAPTYIFWETGTKLKASVGTGFKVPSLFYLYDPLYGNSNLKPEQSFGWDVGIEQFFLSSEISIGANYFYNKFTDMFGFDSNFKTININKAETNGVEIFGTADLIDGLRIKANYTYLNARDKSEDTPEYNQKLVRRPENKAGFYVSYTYNNIANVNIDFMYVGKRDELDFATYPATRIVMPDYFLINFAAYYDLLSFLRLQGRIENLLDKKYQEIYGYGTAGLSFYGGIYLSIN